MHARAIVVAAVLTLSATACVQPTAVEDEGVSSESQLSSDGPSMLEEEGVGEPPVTRAELAAAERRVADFQDIPADMTAEQKAEILARYESIEHAGVRTALWEKAVIYYDINKKVIPNKRWLGILDFSKHSRQRRYWLFDLENGTEAANYVVSHGKKSDPNDDGVATSFSNVSGSNQSSVGYYLTAETYIGSNGRSLKLDGLSATNSNVRERLVVIHGAHYVEDGREKQGMSLGCPAFSHSVVQDLIDKVMGGSLMYAMN